MRNPLCLLIVFTCLRTFAADAVFTFTRTDGTEWRCGSANLESPVLIGSWQPAVGSQTNYFNGNAYWIDRDSNALVKNGQIVGELWNGRTIWPPLQTYWGFTIDALGNGWLISTDSAENDLDFLVRIDLKTANISFLDHVGAHTSARVNGLIVTYPPIAAPRIKFLPVPVLEE